MSQIDVLLGAKFPINLIRQIYCYFFNVTWDKFYILKIKTVTVKQIADVFEQT